MLRTEPRQVALVDTLTSHCRSKLFTYLTFFSSSANYAVFKLRWWCTRRLHWLQFLSLSSQLALATISSPTGHNLCAGTIVYTASMATTFLSTLPFQSTIPSSASNARSLSDLESLPLHLRRAVEPLEPNVPSRKCSFGCIVNSRSLKSRKRWILSLPRLRDSAMSIRIEGHQLSTWRCAYVDHAMFNRLSLGTIVGEYV